MPGPGELDLAGKKVAPQSEQVLAAATVSLKVKMAGNAKKKLLDKGKLKAKLTITFTPTGGTGNAMPKTVKLKRKG